MIIDAQATLSNNQDLNGLNAGSVLSEKSYNCGLGGVIPQTGETITRDPGKGAPVDVLVRVTKAFTSAGSTGTLKVELVMADDEQLATNLVVLEVTDAILVTKLVAGYTFRFRKLPPGTTKQFVGFRYTNATDAFTAGQLFAALGVAPDTVFVG